MTAISNHYIIISSHQTRLIETILMMNKKYITVLCDGMADYPDSRGLTPMDEADKPNMDALCRRGLTGLVQTVPNGMKPGSDVCNLAALGYDPRECYTGRSPLEALSMGIKLADADVTLRVNLVTLSTEPKLNSRTMLDYSAGEITTEEASVLIDSLKPLFSSYGIELYAGISYRHAAVMRGEKCTGAEFTPPHDITLKPIKQHLPSHGKHELFTELIEKSYEILADHDINKTRVSLGKNPANSVWFWGEGTKPSLQNFYDRFHKTAAVISAVDLVKGIGFASGADVINVPTATGTVDTDYDAKLKAAMRALYTHDYCFLHFEGPDECGHQGDRAGKITAIERIDKFILGPLYAHLRDSGLPFAISVMPDHETPLSVRTHTGGAVPFFIYDSQAELDTGISFSEKNAASSGIFFDRGADVIEKLFSDK